MPVPKARAPHAPPTTTHTPHPTPCPQILRLCHGMRYVSLTLDCDEGVQEAISWLRRAHPLSHTTPQRKSQVHHALAEMMAQVRACALCARERGPRALVGARPCALRTCLRALASVARGVQAARVRAQILWPLALGHAARVA